MIIFLIASFLTLSVTSVVNDADKFQMSSNIPEPPSDLSPWQKVVYQLTYPDLFNKAFDPVLTPSEAEEDFYSNALLFGAGLGLLDAEDLALRISKIANKAFQKKVTPLAEFKAFLNDMEPYLWKAGIMTTDNIQSIGRKYYEILEKQINALDTTSGPRDRLVALAKANTEFLQSFGPMSNDDLRLMYDQFNEEWNNV